MTDLTGGEGGGVPVRGSTESKSQRFVICDMELSPFYKMPKVLNGQVHCKEFLVKYTVTGLSWVKFFREV